VFRYLFNSGPSQLDNALRSKFKPSNEGFGCLFIDEKMKA